jgi:hypothetical protein
MQYLIDYLGSVILGSALVLIMANANEIAAENSSLYNGDLVVQEMLTQTAYLLEGELRNMGVGIPESQQSVLWADSAGLGFLYDVDLNGIVDTVRYYAGTTAQMADTQNDLDRPLFRRINANPPLMVGAVTVFRLRYLTRGGVNIATPVTSSQLSEIYSVEITMEVQNPYAMSRPAGSVQTGERDALYSSSLWQQTRLSSQNTRR